MDSVFSDLFLSLVFTRFAYHSVPFVSVVITVVFSHLIVSLSCQRCGVMTVLSLNFDDMHMSCLLLSAFTELKIYHYCK